MSEEDPSGLPVPVPPPFGLLGQLACTGLVTLFWFLFFVASTTYYGDSVNRFHGLIVIGSGGVQLHPPEPPLCWGLDGRPLEQTPERTWADGNLHLRTRSGAVTEILDWEVGQRVWPSQTAGPMVRESALWFQDWKGNVYPGVAAPAFPKNLDWRRDPSNWPPQGCWPDRLGVLRPIHPGNECPGGKP